MYRILSQEERDFLSIIKPYQIYNSGVEMLPNTPKDIKDLWCLFRIKAVKEDVDGYVPLDMNNIKELYCSLHNISYEQYDDFLKALTCEQAEKLFNEKINEIIRKHTL